MEIVSVSEAVVSAFRWRQGLLALPAPEQDEEEDEDSIFLPRCAPQPIEDEPPLASDEEVMSELQRIIAEDCPEFQLLLEALGNDDNMGDDAEAGVDGGSASESEADADDVPAPIQDDIVALPDRVPFFGLVLGLRGSSAKRRMLVQVAVRLEWIGRPSAQSPHPGPILMSGKFKIE